jgi:hypothetical protein
MSLITPFWMLAATTQEKATQPEQLGKVHFRAFCNMAAQPRFDRAMALFHSFCFPETIWASTAVTETDPMCAMSHWVWRSPAPSGQRHD